MSLRLFTSIGVAALFITTSLGQTLGLWLYSPSTAIGGQGYLVEANGDYYDSYDSTIFLDLYRDGYYYTGTSGWGNVSLAESFTDTAPAPGLTYSITYDAVIHNYWGDSNSISSYTTVVNGSPVPTVVVDGRSNGETIYRPYQRSVSVTVRFRATDPDANLTGIRPQKWHQPTGDFDNNGGAWIPQSGGSGEVVRTYNLGADGNWYFWSDAQDTFGNFANSGAWSSGFRLTVVEAANIVPSVTMAGTNITIVEGKSFSISSVASDTESHLTHHTLEWKAPGGNWTSTGNSVALNAPAAVTFPNFAPSSSRTITITPAIIPGTYGVYSFRWVASDGTATSFSSEITVNVQQFIDGDGDGMHDAWEVANSAYDPLADLDHDGLTNVAEYLFGTDPNVSNAGTSAQGNALPAGWSQLVAPGTLPWAVGATKGDLSVGPDGGLSYSVPIWTTPGIAGMEPKVSLNYSSQGGPGIAGLGWSLSGTSTITRGPSTKLVDGYIRGTDFTLNDQYYLDGQRLIYVGGSPHGTAGAEYRTEVESFSKIVAQGAAGAGPESFKVWTKAGLIIELGGTADSRLRRNSFNGSAWVDGTEVYTWAVSKISDTSSNYMAFEYESSSNGLAGVGEQRLREIKYTGNANAATPLFASLKFNYENRSDVTYGFVYGSRYQASKRLQSVVSSLIGGSPIRTYTLSYEANGSNNRSMLGNISESGADGLAYWPLKFEYETSSYGWVSSYNLSPPSGLVMDGKGRGTGFVDLNGDGLPDFVKALWKNSNGTQTGAAWINNGIYWAQNSNYTLPHPLEDDNGDGRGSSFVDFNNDGKVDFLYASKVNGVFVTKAYMNNGTGWTDVSSTWALPTWIYTIENDGKYKKRTFIDINGDGRVDFVYRNGDAGNEPQGAYLNTGSGWQYSAAYIPPFATSWNRHAVFIDLNGDGLPDQIQRQNETYATEGVALNTGSGWNVLAYNSPEFLRYRLPKELGRYNSQLEIWASEFVDVNGDGLTDLVYWDSFTMSEPRTWLNTGNGWFETSEFRVPYALKLGHKGATSGTAMLDLNADGLVDVAQRETGSSPFAGTSALALQSGNGFNIVSGGLTAFPYPLDSVGGQGYARTGTDFVDLNGDGVVDQAYGIDTSWGYQTGAYINTARPHLKLKKVTNGFGVTADVVYEPLTKPGIYTKGTNLSGIATETDQVANVTGPMYVVSTVKHADGLGGTYDLKYTYAKLRSHRTRGSLGFGQTKVLDTRTHIRTTTDYLQDYPYIGMVGASVTELLDSSDTNPLRILSESTATYATKLYNNNKTRFVFALTSEQKSYDIDGVALRGSLTGYSLTTMRGTVNGQTVDFDDYGNSLFVRVQTSNYGSGGNFAKTTVSSYDNYPSSWILGRLTRATVTTEAPGLASASRTSAFTYHPTTGYLLTEVVEPDFVDNPGAGQVNIKVTTSYGYDSFGNKTTATISDPSLTAGARTTTTSFGTTGRFPVSSTNALGHTETYVYHPGFGVMTSLTGPNLLTTSWILDGFGQKIRENRADGTNSETRVKWASANAPSGSLYLIETQTSGGPPAVTFYDSFGRALFAFGVNGGELYGAPRIVGTCTYYDNMGRAYASSLPFVFGSTPALASSVVTYDALSRPLSIRTADDEVSGGWNYSSVSYAGLVTTATNPKGQVTQTTRNLQGQTLETINNATAPVGSVERGRVSYTYDTQGNLLTTTVYREDGAAFTTTLTYDQRGRKIAMNDPDKGTWSYRYNAVGELISQTDALGQTVSISYDQLGRMVTKVEAASAGTYPYAAPASVTTSWTYDTALRINPPAGAPTTWLGKLLNVSKTDDRGKTYFESQGYDDFGRHFRTVRQINGAYYIFLHYFDQSGRLAVTRYPSGFRVRNVYNSYGFLKEVREAAPGEGPTLEESSIGKLFWQADSYALNGQVDGSRFGNGLTYDRVFSEVTGRVRVVTAGVGMGGILAQYHAYSYDSLGNVTYRYDGSTGRTENFTYDGLNRLKTYNLNGGAASTMAYDALGNIKQKNGVGIYDYGSSVRPHAVSHISGGTDAPEAWYDYDANGNMWAGGGRSMQWSVAGHLQKITQGGVTSEFWFGAANERVLQVRSDNTTTAYVGSLYEVTTTPGGLPSEKRHYIMTPLGRTAVYTIKTVAINDQPVVSYSTQFFHQDALGSIYCVSDELGKIEKRFTYDPWGKRVKTADTSSDSARRVTRGFTDHEHLEEFGLIHMNGRVYDPVLGRFLSADPFVDDAEDAQSFNRYSYVNNNPLNYTDPSGYFKFKDVLKIAAVVVAGIITAGVAVYAAGAAMGYSGMTLGFAMSSVMTGGAATWGAGWAAVMGAGAGFGSAFAGSLLNGGNVGDAFKAGIIGAVVGGVSAGIASKIGDFADTNSWFRGAGQHTSHGVLQGALNEAVGGEFRHGFYAGFSSSALAGPVSSLAPGGRMGQTVAAAVMGGTASAVGGGKFANGAVSGAFTYLFNKAGHDSPESEAAEQGKTGYINLQDHEGIDGSHTIREHVGKSDQFLRNRMRGIRRGMFTLYKQAQSTFSSLTSANKLVSSTLSANEAEVRAFLASTDVDQLVVSKNFGTPTGRIAWRDKVGLFRATPIYFVDGTGVTVVIRKAPQMPGGFRVHTAYPIRVL